MRQLFFYSVILVSVVAVTSDHLNGATELSALDPRGSAVLPADTTLVQKSLESFSPVPVPDVTILNQCSRLTLAYRLIVQTPRATSEPTQSEIVALEADLGTLLADRIAAFREAYPGERVSEIGDYYRQYSAFDVGAWRVIYVNGFDRDLAERYLTDDSDWRKKPAIMCDGGQDFFGVEYYPATKTFANFEFNGTFSGQTRLAR